jgi:deoxyribodipyrimidine photo-lyase
MKINIFWFRRDLRLDDNIGLTNALNSGLPIIPVFIFDTNITDELPPDDPRINFIFETLLSLNSKLQKTGSSIFILKGEPISIWKKLIVSFDINAVYINKDYEPYAIQRDAAIDVLLRQHQIPLLRFKDQVVFEEGEILKSDNSPYTVFTPYKKRWLQKLAGSTELKVLPLSKGLQNFHKCSFSFPSRDEFGFGKSSVTVRPFDLSAIKDYDKYRDLPSVDRTSYLGPHLRFGTVSIRTIVSFAVKENAVFLSELIWRDFFMQILFHFPQVMLVNFRPKYNEIEWRNNESEFERWCQGQTGYPFVDAGMRQLNKTGYIHNRVRMITAGFLCKHLLIDWRWGEAYFAQKLLDYELSSNNGNWQWAAGTGCDAAPYFRIFNPGTQLQKFDRDKEYVRKWIEEIDVSGYPKPMVDHDFARKRAIAVFNSGIRKIT